MKRKSAKRGYMFTRGIPQAPNIHGCSQPKEKPKLPKFTLHTRKGRGSKTKDLEPRSRLGIKTKQVGLIFPYMISPAIVPASQKEARTTGGRRMQTPAR